MKGRLNWAPLRSFDPLILYRAAVRGCVRSLKFKSRKLSPGSGSALQSLLHIPFSPLTDWAGEIVWVNTFAARPSLTCFHICCPFFITTFCSSANRLNLVTISALDCMHTLKNTNAITGLYAHLFISWSASSIICKSTNMHVLELLSMSSCQADVSAAPWRWTNMARPVPWAQKALSNNALKRPHAAGSKLGFVASARSLTHSLEGEQNVSFTLNELWIYSESSIFTLAVSNVSCCRQSWIMKMSA